MLAPDLQFEVEAAEALRFAASPHIVFKLRITNRTSFAIHSIMLRCEAHLDAARRQYSRTQQERLKDLFGEPERWGQTLRGLFWTSVNTIVPSFTDHVVAQLHVPCTFDFNVAATKYFSAIDDGEIPVSFFFNGTIFYASESDSVQVCQIPWEKEATYRMRTSAWREMMDAYYPRTAWLCLERDAFDRLYAFKVERGLPTFEQALIQALGSQTHEPPSDR